MSLLSPSPIVELRRGTLHPQQQNHPVAAVILSESWPVWLPIATNLALGFHCLASYVQDDPNNLPVWQQVIPEVRWHEYNTATDVLIDYKDTNILMVSGSCDFMSRIWTHYGAHILIIGVLDLHSIPTQALYPVNSSWMRLAHPDFGGVTMGHWHLGISLHVDSTVSPQPSQRRLRHCLSPMEKGRPHPPPEDPEAICSSIYLEKGLLHPGGFISPTDVRHKVLAPSVFSKTGWVARSLTTHELAVCYDMPDQLLQLIPNESMQGTNLNSLTWVRYPPLKLLHGYMQFVQPLVDQRRKWPIPLPAIVSAGLSTESLAHDTQKELDKQYIHEACGPLLLIFNENGVPISKESPSMNGKNDLGRHKAAKNDDAEIPIFYWDSLVWEPWLDDNDTLLRAASFGSKYSHSPLTPIRHFALAFWRTRIWKSFRRFMGNAYVHGEWHLPPTDSVSQAEWSRTISAARDCIWRCDGASWWDWTMGSRLLFWRWPAESFAWARDGLPIWLTCTPPQYRKLQPKEANEEIRALVQGKLDKIRTKGYIQPGSVKGLLSYFSVPKGEGDIRLVFDGTKSGLNACIWVPGFSLPTVNTLLTSLEAGTWMADIDISEQFYNYILDPHVRSYCGVDLNPYFPELRTWETWERCVMGLKSSPYGCIRMDLLGEEVIRGCTDTPDNPFHFDRVQLNLPGSPDYNPSLPWVCKFNTVTGRIAGDMQSYVDDKRTTGSTYLHCVQVSRRVGSMLGYLGSQDASRKRVPPSQRAGAWAGSVCHTDGNKVTVLCTQDKWDKAKDYVRSLLSQLDNGETRFNHKDLERIRGFLVYVVRTYPSLNPYLKGIHLTLDSWRPQRDAEGWRIENQVRHHLDPNLDHSAQDEEPPAFVTAVPRLHSDLSVLSLLMSSSHPPRRVIRASEVMVVWYGFADASGSGFGSSVLTPEGIKYRFGLWGRDLSHQSSNFREFHNLIDTVQLELADVFPELSKAVDAISSLIMTNSLEGVELFLFTDNIVAEGAFYRGTSSNPKLFSLILRLRNLETSYGLRLHVIHVAGKRMIAQGTDGLSRGNTLEGVLRGAPMLSFVPLHLDALDRSPAVYTWLQQWCPTLHLHLLSPFEWFSTGHGVRGASHNCDGVWIPSAITSNNIVLVWSPAPTAADVALEQLSLSRHKRPHLAHIVICPRLFTHAWRKKLYKLADFTFYLYPGRREDVWPLTAYEPLMVGVLLPFLSTFPWCLRHSPPLLQLETELRSAWAHLESDEIPVLMKLWSIAAMI
jgi:hypothetical protein